MEALVALALLALLAAAAVPHLNEARSRARMSAGSRQAAALFRKCRAEAISRGRTVAVDFKRVGPGWLYSVHEDTDGDGISASDIAGGTDRRLSGPFPIGREAPGVEFSILQRPIIPRVPPQSGNLTNPADPIRFGAADRVSFTPLGRATPGTAYLSDGNRAMAAVVVYGATGRVRVWRWDDTAGTWAR